MSQKIQLSRLSPLELAAGAIQDQLNFKLVLIEIGKRPPNRKAAEFVIDAYQQEKSPPWLTAALLGECRDPIGYATAREIILAAPRSLAESYAGVAMAKIGGLGSMEALVQIMSTASDRKSREGAAFGLEALKAPACAAAILEAAVCDKIGTSTAGCILGRTFPNDSLATDLLSSPDRKRVQLGTQLMESCIRSIRAGMRRSDWPSLLSRPSARLMTALANVLSDSAIMMRPTKRKCLQSWLTKSQRRSVLKPLRDVVK